MCIEYELDGKKVNYLPAAVEDQLKMVSKKYFGTDGIRGTTNKENINGNMFFKFGLASGTYFKSQKKRKQIAIPDESDPAIIKIFDRIFKLFYFFCNYIYTF